MNLEGHTVSSYDEQLKHLSTLIAQMVGELQKLMQACREAFHSDDEQRIADAKATDKIINQIDEEIERAAAEVLALQNPMAVDLRFVISVLKITALLEQAGDMAKNTVKRSIRMGKVASKEAVERLEKMTMLIDKLLTDALNAFETRDATLATAVWKRDDEVDVLYKELMQLMEKEMSDTKDRVPACMHVMFAAKNLERLADYIANFAKTVYYINSGKRADKSILKEE